MKKLKVLMICLIAVLLTGCMQMNVTLEVNEDGKGKMGLEYLVEESYLESNGGSTDQIKQSLLDGGEVNEDDYTFKDITRKVDGKNYVGISAVSKKYVALPKDFSIKKESNKLTLTIDTSSITDSMTSQLGDTDYSMEDLESFIKMQMIVTMPWDIKSATDAESDGKTVTYNLLKLKSDKVVIEAEKADNTLMYVGIGAGVLVVIVIAVVIVLKKKNKPTPANENTTTVLNNEKPVEENTTTTQQTEVKEDTTVIETEVKETEIKDEEKTTEDDTPVDDDDFL